MENITLEQIGLMVAFVVAFAKGIEYLINPFTKSSKRIDNLEDEMKVSKEDRQELHEFMRLNFICIKELLKHNIENGNNIEGMKMASNEIDKYLSKKI